MNVKLPRRQDLDSEIMPLFNPFKAVLQLGCLFTLLMTIISWLLLLAAMTAGVIAWRFWPYVVAPVVGWVILLGWPAMLKARRGALSILEAVATTAEAWLARAGYSIDLNNDGYIGGARPVEIEPVNTQIVSPAVFSGPGGVKLLAQDAAAIPQVAAQPAEAQAAPAPPRRLWDLPGGVKCPEETVREFVERIFIVGWSRETWTGAGKPLERETYDALLNLLVQAQIIEGRKAGHAGKLAVEDPATARRVLGLA